MPYYSELLQSRFSLRNTEQSVAPVKVATKRVRVERTPRYVSASLNRAADHLLKHFICSNQSYKMSWEPLEKREEEEEG